MIERIDTICAILKFPNIKESERKDSIIHLSTPYQSRYIADSCPIFIFFILRIVINTMKPSKER